MDLSLKYLNEKNGLIKQKHINFENDCNYTVLSETVHNRSYESLKILLDEKYLPITKNIKCDLQFRYKTQTGKFFSKIELIPL